MGFAKAAAIRGALLVALPWAGRMLWSLREEITARRLRAGEASDLPGYGDLWQAAGAVAVLVPLQLLFRPFFGATARAMIPRKQRWSQEVWQAKVVRCCDAVFKCVYFLVMTVWGWALLRQEPWLPWALGGSGETRFCWADNFPLQSNSLGLRRFYLAALGFHVSEVVMLLTEAELPDFWEMLLHHIVSSSLVFFSYMLNYLRIGSMVLFIHGSTDVLIYLSKVFVDTPYIKCTGMAYFGLLVSYAWFRIYVFPAFVLRSSWVESRQYLKGNDLFGWGYMNFGLIVLLTLHMYWFGLIVKIGLVFRKSGQPRDLHANLSELDMQKGLKKRH
eukprot:TRINITY_DN26358_c0_g6_i1.p1 TRINITY_DN26358_c0_g6~~TRINITY_DN26358_c0_g6_i1.p1  ORF type:complete len:331 (+),score=71.77 TRINITY_DN26358_c0_g6_i1:76-1068(+)